MAEQCWAVVNRIMKVLAAAAEYLYLLPVILRLSRSFFYLAKMLFMADCSTKRDICILNLMLLFFVDI